MKGPTIVEEKHLAVIGDKVVCPCKGGPHKIVSGAPTADLYGVPVARVGDKSSCGATITTGTPKFTIRGKDAALHGSQTSCGGQVVTSTGWVPSYSQPAMYDEGFVLKDKEGNVLPDTPYLIVRQDGSQERGITDLQGLTHRVREHASSEILGIYALGRG